jgi:hypothetical protein
MIVFFNELVVRAFDLTHGRLLSWEVIVAGRRRVLAGRSGVLASPLLRTLFDDQILTHGQSASPHLIPNRSLDRHPCCSVTPWPSSWLNATCLVSLRTFLVSHHSCRLEGAESLAHSSVPARNPYEILFITTTIRVRHPARISHHVVLISAHVEIRRSLGLGHADTEKRR